MQLLQVILKVITVKENLNQKDQAEAISKSRGQPTRTLTLIYSLIFKNRIYENLFHISLLFL